MLEITKLSKNYGGKQALCCVSEYIKQGETVSVVGPSGCGKTTFLRCISLIETPDAGEVTISGESVSQKHGCIGLVCANASVEDALCILDSVLSVSGASSAMLFDDPSRDIVPVIRKASSAGVTAIIATGDMLLAAELSGRVLFMDNGEIKEQGSPEDVLCHPQLASTREYLASVV